MTNVLNVAEKNDAAKNLSEILSNGHYNRRDGFSRYNKIYEFDYEIGREKCNMIMTSVSGHLLNNEFTGQFKNWKSCNPVALFEAPIINVCPDNYKDIKRTLEREAKNCKKLIIWTDGDREGENIGFEIIRVCLNVNPSLKVLRARFSEITRPAISRAINNLQVPDKKTSDAVEVRKELDLRIGAAFTRFQTTRLQRLFPEVLSNNVISYGSCQFPTMGFVVERYKRVKDFKPQTFWRIEVDHEREKIHTIFLWKRTRLFDKCATVAFCVPCWNDPRATVISVKSKNKSKWRPLPLDTVELEMNCSRKLGINAKETMRIAESLYTKGFISYPRTETNTFPKEMNLAELVQMQTVDPNWGDFARRVIEIGPNPRQGTKTDNAHPPIHPTKYTATLAALALLTTQRRQRATKAMKNRSTISSFVISWLAFRRMRKVRKPPSRFALPPNYFQRKEVPEYKQGEVFEPDSIDIEEGSTIAPSLLTEADLISLMEKHGIGTDATHAEHIEKIKSRMYVGLNNEEKFAPTELGMGLVNGYDSMGVKLSKPNYRAELESDLKRICEGTKNPNDVLKQQIRKYKDIFIQAVRDAAKIDAALSQYFGAAEGAKVIVMKCPKCRTCDISLKKKKDGKSYFLACIGFPACRTSIWFPDSIETAKVSEEICTLCQNGPVRKINFTHRMYNVVEEHTVCFGGCDTSWFEKLDIRPFNFTGGEPSGSGSRHPTAKLKNISTNDGNRRTNSVNYSEDKEDTNAMPNRTIKGVTRVDVLAKGPFPHKRRRDNTAEEDKDTEGSSRDANVGESSGSSSTGKNKGANSRNRRRKKNSNLDETRAHHCFCGTPAIRLSIKKEGPNEGRKFFRCAKTSKNCCKFFVYEDRLNESLLNQNSTNSTNSTSEVTEKCSCGETCILKPVVKKSANNGRMYFACSKPQGQSCKFFKWAE